MMEYDLINAVKNDNESEVIRLINAGADANQTERESGKTALFYAVQQSNNESVVRALIDAKADVNRTDNEGKTALFEAVCCSNESIVHLLVKKGYACIDTRDHHGRTPLFYAIAKSTKIASCLFERTNVNDSDLCSILQFFLENRKSDTSHPPIDKVLKLLKDNGLKPKRIAKAIVNIVLCKIPLLLTSVTDSHPSENSLTSIQIQWTRKMESLINVLKEVSKYVETTTKERVIRMLELIEGHREDHISDVFSLLKEFGANPNCADIDGNTAFHNVMHLPFLGVPKETVLDLCERLLSFGVPLTKGNHHGETPLLFCLSRSFKNLEEEDKSSAVKTLVDVCTFLVYHGSNIEETTKHAESVLHLIIKLFQQGIEIRDEKARKNVIDEALKLLELFSSDRMIKGNTVNKRDFHLHSPLHCWASLAPSTNYSSSESFRLFTDTLEKILQHLMNLGTILNARNEYEKTPLHLCETWTAVKLLLAAGANPNDVDSSGSSPLLVAAKKNFGMNLDRLYPDILEDPDEFWESAIEKGLEPWTVNNYGMSVFGVLLHSEALILAKALVNVTCKKPNAHRGTILLKMTNALFYAVQQSNNESVVRVLIDADVNKTDNKGKTALFYAVQQSNNESVVRTLINAGADVNKTDNEGKTALFYAVQQSSNESVVCSLIDGGADGKAVLFYAAKNDKPGVAEAIHDAGLDLNITDDDGKTAVFYANENNSIAALCELIECGANFDLDEIDGKAVLFYVAKNDKPGVAEKLHDAGLDLDITDDDGKTAVFYANENNSIAALCELIECGANFDLDEIDGKAVLFYVAKNDKPGLAEKLRDADLDLDITDDDGKTALALAVENDSMDVVCELIKGNAHFVLDDIDGKAVLFHAAKYNKKGVVKPLRDAGLDLNETDNEGKTAVFYANMNYSEVVLCELIECGADFDLDEIDGKVAMFCAVGHGMDEAVSKLLSGLDVNTTDNQGKTALLYAVQQSNKSVVRTLINAGADVKITDNEGKNSLFYAVQKSNSQSVVRTLIKAGIDVTITDNEGKTALFYAVDRDAVDALIEEDEGLINARDQYGRTALFYALKQDSMTTARYLIKKGGNLYLKDKCGVSIFTFFIKKSSYRALTSDVSELFQGQNQLKSLVAAVLDVIYCQAPLLYAKSFLLRNGYQYQYTILDETYLLETLTFARTQGFTQDDNKRKAFDKIAFLISKDKVDVPSILALLNTLGANPDAADSDGNTALHYATLLPLYGVSQETVIHICKKLKDLGAMFDVKNQQQQSPLLLCLSVNNWNWKVFETNNPWDVDRGLAGVCSFLLSNGSSVNETSQSGESAFHLLMKFVQKRFNLRGLRPPDVLQELIELLKLVSSKALERGKEKIANKTDGQLNSPLHLWASLTLPSSTDYISHLQDHTFENILQLIFDILMQCGAKLNLRNENEDTPLHLCKTWAAAKLLIKAGAITNDLNSSKRSPLLVAAKEKTYLKKPGCFYPDVSQEKKAFWKEALALGLDPWTVDKHDESVLSILVESEAFELAKSLVDVACEDNYTKSEAITISLLNALCKDKSIRTNRKANLVQDILKSRKSSTSLSKPLRYCCKNVIETGVRNVKQEDKTDSAVAALVSEGDDDEAPSPKRRRTDESDGKSEAQADLCQGPVTVHCEIIKLLRWYGAGVEACEEIGKEYSQLTDLLFKPLTDEQIKEFIPWTSVSKKYKDKLAKVARRQEYKVINQISIWYHKDHIGSGSFGDIFAGINEKDGREVAIKRIVKLRLQRPEDKREIQNLTALADCQQVVRYVSFFEDQDFSYVVLELMEGNLEEYLNESTIDATEATLLCKDVVMGLKFLHEQNILHRDLKPQNILYKTHPKLCLKIADFGLSRRIDSTSTTVYGTIVGTRCWIAPEVLKSPKDHSKSSDMFSCGLLLHYILSGQKHPFSPADCANKREVQVAHETEDNLMKGKMEGWDNSLSPEASHLVRKMIESTVKNRPTAEEAIDHPLFWAMVKKIDFLIAVGNQPEFMRPHAKRGSMGPLTALDTDLEASFGTIVKCGSWNDPGYVHMPAIYTKMTRWRSYDTCSVVQLVRFIRNVYSNVSHDTRPSHFRKLLLEDFVFVEYFPALVMEVYKAVTTHGWDQTRDEIKYTMRNK